MRIVVSYRGIPGRQGWACGDWVADALSQLGHEVYRYGTVYGTDDRIDPIPPPWHRPDLLLWMECNDQDPQYLELLDWKCRKVMWDFDTSMHPALSMVLAQHFDVCCWGNWLWARARGETYLPYAFSDGLLARSFKTDEVAIIGTLFGQRREFAEAVGIEIKTGLYGQDYVDAVWSLLCHVHHFDSGGRGLLVSRIWETMGLGTCLLTHEDEALRETFGSHPPLLTYRTTDEAKRLIADVRSCPQWALNLGADARRLILEKHTYRQRVKQMLEVVG